MASNLQIVAPKIVSADPATGEALREFECASEPDVHAAVARARAAQPAWADLDVRQRIAILRDFPVLLHQKKSYVAQLVTREAGKPYVEALLTEVLVVLDAARFLIDNAYRLRRDEPVPHGNLAMKTKSGRLVREPYGVIGIISPWNYPFSIPATESLAALVAGNGVVVKPSEFTSLTAVELASLLHQAGVPREIFQIVIGDGVTGAALIKRCHRQVGLCRKRTHREANRTERRSASAAGRAGTGRQRSDAGARPC
jgi:succinate-semialdehyde dehydrogenase/glutarate-semialdehyde dehydrogenase